ncbi:DUF2851 family protein [Limibacterium fermenti]|uniref:DUF2851 family protein n=1 Tax=Limibacterium fermenti TaxID=3229863 RepID=UPI000E8FDECB|nr:DUF2851 domain-containing protein [Porphyromonadaceae bacterium]
MSRREELLQYVWKFGLFDRSLIETTEGEKIEIIDAGLLNTDAGPDFFNAKIKIGNTLWAGNIEIHHASDEWKKHGHHTDKAYNSVILHVVEEVNSDVRNQKGEVIPQCVIKVPEEVRENAEYLLYADEKIPCKDSLSLLDKRLLHAWLSALTIERLERKTQDIFAHLKRFNNSWDETFYVLLVRNFGFGLNSDQFERLALSLPYNYIQKHGDSLFQIEALLFGQAGLLEEGPVEEDYFLKLKNEYAFLKKKYLLNNLDGFVFKKLHVRPRAFPQIRLAQLAALLQKSGRLFSVVLEQQDYPQMQSHFQVNPSDYWQTHYSFGKSSVKSAKYLGAASFHIILINTVVPILFAYGKKTADEAYCGRAVDMLESVKPEKNSIIDQFREAGVIPEHAADTQALIQLRKAYCEPRKCLYCRIGHAALSSRKVSSPSNGFPPV